MAVTHVQVLSVPVTDQDRARAFYVDILGFELAADFPMTPDMRWLMVKPVGGQTALTLVTWFPSMPAGSLKGLVLETPTLDADVERLTGLGLDIPNGIEDAPWGRYAQFTDPDGNGIILQATYANA
jgi:catechol 2,3-dioxygenase-like lactoylglutathione lyase family enzyme